MPRLDADTGAGVFTTLMSGVVGVPLLIRLSAGEDLTAIPGWLWVTCYVMLLAAQITATWLNWWMSRRVVLAVYAACVALGPVIVLGAPQAGWLPIVLVLTAALGSYLVPGIAVAAVIVLNTAVVGVGVGMNPASTAADVAFSALIYGVIQAATALSVLATVKEARTRQELAVAHAELKATAAALAETSRSAERLRIARDLHDAVGHQLTSLALELEVASHRPEESSERIERSRTIARDLLTEVRSVVSDLRSQTPDLRTALEAMVEDIPQPEVRMNVAAHLPVDDERVLAIVRCVQEVVTNAIKHSGARTLWIDVTRDGDDMVLHARDNGVARGEIVPGNGLTSISERAAEFGGTARFTADAGFRVEWRIPSA